MGGGSGSTVVPRVTTYTYDADKNRTSASSSDSVSLVGATSGANSSSSLSLTLPTGSRAGDTAVLSTTTGSGAEPSLERYAANDIYLVAGVPGEPGVGGLGQQANENGQLGAPNAVALDAAGDVYVANQDDEQRRRDRGQHPHPVGPVHDGRGHLPRGRQLVGDLGATPATAGPPPRPH